MIRYRITAWVAVFALVTPLIGCATPSGNNDKDPDEKSHTGETVGTLVGAIGGAILGSRVGRGRASTLAAIAGGVLGAWAGGRLGRSFDERDRKLQSQAADDAMKAPIGQPVPWSNPDSGNSGSVTPLREDTRPTDGATCRRFEQIVTTKDGRTALDNGTACRAPDGTWRISG
jgi:surface antigen